MSSEEWCISVSWFLSPMSKNSVIKKLRIRRLVVIQKKKDLLKSVLKVRICFSQSRVGGRGVSMVSGALGNIFTLCLHMFLLCRFALFLLPPPFLVPPPLVPWVAALVAYPLIRLWWVEREIELSVICIKLVVKGNGRYQNIERGCVHDEE